MTITANNGRIDYSGNGSTTVFAYDFLIFDQAHIKVYLDGVLKTISTHYTVSGVGEAAGGNVTFVTAPGSGVTVTLLRESPLTQATDYQTGGKFPAETHEDALDKLTMIAQEHDRRLRDTLTLEVDSLFQNLTLPDPVSQRLLRWKTNLSGLENVAASDLTVFSGALITAEGDLVIGGAGGVPERLAVGTTGQALEVVAGRPVWATSFKTILDAKGDLIAATAADTPARVAVGANRTILEADSAASPGVAWVARALGLKSMQVFTGSGTWTRPAGIRKVLVQVVGGGGGGGGVDGAAATSAVSSGGGGGGGCATVLLDVSAIASATITIGAGGAGGVAGANSGSAGTASSWADGTNTVTGNGGGGGSFGNDNVAAPGGTGGSGTATGGFVAPGGPGQGGFFNSGGITCAPTSGGSSHLGGGATGSGANANGTAAPANTGGGGSGCVDHGSETNRSGGAGGSGIIVVYEYE